MDYFVNPALALAPDRDVQVHNKFFKARESLRARAARKGIQLRLLGQSNAQVEGRRIFEVIPFILLENAIKYSPENLPVDIVFQETENTVSAIVRNYGPALNLDEMGHVFEIGKRGANAEAARISGYGIGLHFAKELVERHHQGTIEFKQTGDDMDCYGVNYRNTEIVLTFPKIR